MSESEFRGPLLLCSIQHTTPAHYDKISYQVQ